MNSRQPKIKVKKDKLTSILTLLSFLFSILSWVIAIYYYPTLPEQIPSHLDIKGEVDDYGSKVLIFALPFIGLLTVILLNYISTIPHHYNYPIQITKENAKRQYNIASKMISQLAFSISIVFLSTNIEVIYIAIRQVPLLGVFNIIMTILAVFIPIFLYFWNVRK